MTDQVWGLGTEPSPENVPVGVHGVDKFGNRTVTLTTPLADGTKVMVEGIGTGINGGKPDGEWWPESPLTVAGPTNAAAWVTDTLTPPAGPVVAPGVTATVTVTTKGVHIAVPATTTTPAKSWIVRAIVDTETLAQTIARGIEHAAQWLAREAGRVL